jgi:hypothetical protein
LLALWGGPAYAQQLVATSARAFGASIDLLNSPLLPPTPNVTAGPGPGTGSNNLLTVPLSTLVSAGVVSAKARTTLNPVITPELPADRLRVFQPAGAPRPAAFNAQAYARVTGAVIAAQEGAELPPAVGALFGQGTVLSADVIHAEALVGCVAGGAVIVGGSQLAGATLLGVDLTQLLDGTLNQVVPIGNTVLSLLGGSLIANETVQTTNGVAINALHLNVPNLLDVTLAHAEVSGAACREAPECSDGIDNDGDGRIDIADPECHTDGNPDNPASYDPNDDSEAGLLPRTGGSSPLLGVIVFSLGALLLLGVRKLRRSEIG